MTTDDEQARAALEELIAELGLAFHPERPVASYVRTASGGSVDEQLAAAAGVDVEDWLVFEPADAERLQAGLDLAWAAWGDEIYAVIRTFEPWTSFFDEQETST